MSTIVSLSVHVRRVAARVERWRLDRARQDAQFVALSATNKSVTIVKAVSRGNVRHLRMQVRDGFARAVSRDAAS
jgi:hypothetical protein